MLKMKKSTHLCPHMTTPDKGSGLLKSWTRTLTYSSPSSSTPLCDILSGCCFFTGPWTVIRSSLRMLRRVAAFCQPPRPVLLLVSFPRSQGPVVGVLGLCQMWQDVCASAAPSSWCLEVVLVVAGVV